jgi:hypothetical protein
MNFFDHAQDFITWHGDLFNVPGIPAQMWNWWKVSGRSLLHTFQSPILTSRACNFLGIMWRDKLVTPQPAITQPRSTGINIISLCLSHCTCGPNFFLLHIAKFSILFYLHAWPSTLEWGTTRLPLRKLCAYVK